MMQYSKREHDMAIGAATAEAMVEIQKEMNKESNGDKIYDPNLGLEAFSEAYEHALELYAGHYPDSDQD
ncbi:hypothetical protein ACIPCB_00955 [Pediococcus pentosaceus]|uniref:Uncharacterized protein n=3 Tax=Lactobacillaceae TaxID=33958 RepID=A0ABD7X6M2_PEDPE|nr:hypothetical protein [Pediococcus pentosaceus]MCV3324940.1 hypothetical protein [Pediococcus pentosaceus]WEA57282.1 hypothetical protein PWB86_08855 [Pediococcus pentosaceus]